MVNKKIKVLITSIDAGGGHKELKENFVRTLGDDKDLIIGELNSVNQNYDKIYHKVQMVPGLWNSIYEVANGRYIGRMLKPLITIQDKKECLKVLEDFNPDIIICTHFAHAIIFTDLKRKLNLKYIVISCVYDYGDQFPQLHIHTLPDYYFVRDEVTQNYMRKYVGGTMLRLFGTSVHKAFEAAASYSDSMIEHKFKDFIKDYFPDREADFSRKSILFIGGSGWTRKSESLIKELNNEENINIFVCCGKDEDFKKELLVLKNVYAFGFVDKDTLATVEKAVNAIVMSSIAPATMHELMAVHSSPMFLHRFIAGQESHHVSLLGSWKIGIYIPDNDKMIIELKNYFKNPDQYKEMIENQKKIRENEIIKCKLNADIIKNIFYSDDKAKTSSEPIKTGIINRFL